jgi:hypothetical protein
MAPQIGSGVTQRFAFRGYAEPSGRVIFMPLRPPTVRRDRGPWGVPAGALCTRTSTLPMAARTCSTIPSTAGLSRTSACEAIAGHRQSRSRRPPRPHPRGCCGS